MFDQSHPVFWKYKSLLESYKAQNLSLEQENQGRRKRKNRWDEGVQSSQAQSLPTEKQNPQAGSSSSSPGDFMAEFERAKALIQQKAAAAKATAGVSSVDLERQKQIETQQEVCEIIMY